MVCVSEQQGINISVQLGRFGVGTLGEVLVMFTASVGVVHLYHGVCGGRGQAPESLSSYHLDIEKKSDEDQYA